MIGPLLQPSTGNPGGPQPYQTAASPATQMLGLLPGPDRLPGLGTDLAAQVDEENKLRKKKLETLSPTASPAAIMLLGGAKANV